MREGDLEREREREERGNDGEEKVRKVRESKRKWKRKLCEGCSC
jgi:hypothetical protein